jgi:BirA family biotin operon repressor/biotin-[acetyl-CoA-carboxylase] ligase
VLGASDPAPQSLSLVAGLALIEAVDLAEPGQPLMLKWPNDLLLNGKKLSGILLERAGDRVVIGFGVNLSSAPAVPDKPVAALSGRLTPQAFAPLLAGSFARLLGLWRASAPALMAHAWLSRGHPVGTEVTVHASAEERVSGRFDGLEPDGALRLRLADGRLQIVRAGDVEL